MMQTWVPLRLPTIDAYRQALAQLATHSQPIHRVELWLDQLLPTYGPDLPTLDVFQDFLRQLPRQYRYLAVCRRPELGGACRTPEPTRQHILQSFIDHTGGLIDLDFLHDPTDTLTLFRGEHLILSVHDFAGVPDLSALVPQQLPFAPRALKYAVTPHTDAELVAFCQQLQTLRQQVTLPVVATTMGPAFGAVGRAQLQSLGLTDAGFFALSPAYATASGQPTLADTLSGSDA